MLVDMHAHFPMHLLVDDEQRTHERARIWWRQRWQGRVVELRCTWDPDSRGGNARDGRKVKGTLHWVSERHAVPAEVRLYDRLFATAHPGEGCPRQSHKQHDTLCR